MPSIGAQKRECKREILRRLVDQARVEPYRMEGRMIGLAARLANRMTLPELQEWQAKLEELDNDP